MKISRTAFTVIIVAGIATVIAAGFPLYEHGLVFAQSPSIQTQTKSSMPSGTGSSSASSYAAEINSTAPSGVMYTSKFECGSIFAGEGPLRPGHYDTDVSMFNKERSETTILWNVVMNNGPSSNAALVNLGPENATSITCQDIRQSLQNYNQNFLEGFIIVNVPFGSALQSSKGVIVSNTNYDTNPLQVQAFYTANALDTLPHEVIVDKIAFYIIQDYTGKIPQKMLRTTLDVSLPSTLNQLSNTDDRVKEVLASQYNLTSDDLPKIVVRISSINVGVGTLIDDHAISLSTVQPQLVP